MSWGQPAGAPGYGQATAPAYAPGQPGHAYAPGQASAPTYPPIQGGAAAYQSYNQAPFQHPPQGPPPGIAPELWNWFQSVDTDRSGRINAMELKAALMNGNYTSFGEGTCRLMIRMFDRDRSGMIDINEFSALWKYITEWRACFDRFDRDRSGTISTAELTEAMGTFGYRLSPQFCQNLVRTYSARRQAGAAAVDGINFDDFIEACVTIKNLTETFSRNDTQRSGVITIGFEQFLDMVVQNTV